MVTFKIIPKNVPEDVVTWSVTYAVADMIVQATDLGPHEQAIVELPSELGLGSLWIAGNNEDGDLVHYNLIEFEPKSASYYYDFSAGKIVGGMNWPVLIGVGIGVILLVKRRK